MSRAGPDFGVFGVFGNFGNFGVFGDFGPKRPLPGDIPRRRPGWPVRRWLPAVLAVWCGVAGSAAAQGEFPQRRITLVASASTGGGLDGLARLLSRRMQEAWGQPAVVENLGGADGLLAAQRVASAPADGHTMLLTIPSLLLLKHNLRDLPFDPVGALAPVSELAQTPSAVAVHARSGIASLRELVAHCNAAPVPCTWGTGQQLSYLYGRRLFAATGLREAQNIPYKGTGPVVNDLLAGHIAIGMTSIVAPLPHHQKGTLRILAINAARRSPQAPEVPTFREAGVDLPARGTWYGLFVPRATPADVIARIGKLMATLAADAQAQEVVRTLGAEPVFGGSADFARAIREEQAFLDGLVRQYPLK